MPPRRICAVTGSRADYGLLSVVMREIRDSPAFSLQVVATGAHLSPEFGLTYRAIEEDGFTLDARVELLLSSDTPVGVAKSLGLGVIGFADALRGLQPDLLLLLGDRYEILAAALAAHLARIPIAHIAGGDSTEGALDEALRHGITKLAHLHFTTNEASARRVRQLGENPAHVFNVGSPGLDVIRRVRPLGRQELERELGFSFRARNLLVTFHPATLDPEPAGRQFGELLAALDRLGPDTGIIFTLPNADGGGRVIAGMIAAHVAARPQARAYASLGQLRYLSVVASVDAVVGNSSSGIYEVPSFGKPTVNIGDRQKGRIMAASVIGCEPVADDIARAIAEAFTRDCRGVRNPYGDGTSAERIVAALEAVPDFGALLVKHFFEMAP